MSWITDIITYRNGKYAVGHDHVEPDEGAPRWVIQKLYPNTGADGETFRGVWEVSDTSSPEQTGDGRWTALGYEAETLEELVDLFAREDPLSSPPPRKSH